LLIKKRNRQTFESTKLGGKKKTPLSINNMTNLRTEKTEKRKTHKMKIGFAWTTRIVGM
jgi:hypothetical protein